MTGDEFKQRFIPLGNKMFNVAVKMSSNTQEAEDIVQDAFMRLWNKRDSLPSVDNDEAYCVALTKNICYDRLRRKCLNIAKSPPEELPLSTGTDLSSDFDIKDHAEIIKRCIDRLPEKQRIIMTMRDIYGLEYSEIRTATGYNDTDIRVTLSRARKTIREQFKIITNYGKR